MWQPFATPSQQQKRSSVKTARVLVRASGTEQLLRVMVEGKDQAEIEQLANAIADVVREAIGA